MSLPVFAVVGHPNKGKSSIVSTLAHDDRIAVSFQSGTTTVAETLTVNILGERYQLVDTPGFQRPSKVLQWLKSRAGSAGERANAVRQFVQDPDCLARFPDEVELLSPIVNGAAILYVVDGSRPYGVEYEAEMEILRWTGQASMALINPIESEAHVAEWQRALSQYFRVVRVFDALEADFSRQLSILQAFGMLREDWNAALQRLISAAGKKRRLQARDSVRILAELLRNLCYHRLTREVASREEAGNMKADLEQQFYRWIRGRERESLSQLQQLYGYRDMESELFDLPQDEDLFDMEKWVLWGLNRRQLVVAASLGGAAAGALIDLGLAGSSLMLGALSGGMLAGGGAWLGANRIAEFKIEDMPLGAYEARYGPVRNRNFPYVILGRFLFLLNILRSRNHARRDRVSIAEGDLQSLLDTLNRSDQASLHMALGCLSRQKEVDNLEQVLEPLLEDPMSDGPNNQGNRHGNS